MAVVAGVSRDWEYEAAHEEAAPVTSRSPSFIRIRSAAPAVDDNLDVIVAESRHAHRHDTIVAPPPVVLVDPIPSTPRLEDVELDLQVRVLRLEATSPHAAACLGEEITELGAELRALATSSADATALVQHTHEWATNVIVRLTDPSEAEDGELAVAEYSSLFVRKILVPMIETAIESNTRWGASACVAQLHALYARIVWLNWSVGTLH